MKKVFVILAICFMAVMPAAAQSVGYVDTEKILSCIQEYPDAQNELNTLAENLNTMAGQIDLLIQKNMEEQKNFQKAVNILYRMLHQKYIIRPASFQYVLSFMVFRI